MIVNIALFLYPLMTETEENQVTKVDLDMSPQRRIEGWGSNMQYDADGNVSRINPAYLNNTDGTTDRQSV